MVPIIPDGSMPACEGNLEQSDKLPVTVWRSSSFRAGTSTYYPYNTALQQWAMVNSVKGSTEVKQG